MHNPIDSHFMHQAFRLAKQAVGTTHPNPAVGCVIVKDNLPIAYGQTAPGGRPHAEQAALDFALQHHIDVSGAIAYVTLEPCSHYGKTPPCADALIAAGIARVVIGVDDPNPDVNGQGIAKLESAGIAVETNILQHRLVEFYRPFFARFDSTLPQRPHISLKVATSLDGKTALANGTSQWITGPQARRYTHLLRHQHDAILIGSRTALADQPQLTARDPAGLQSPIRIVLDATGKTLQTNSPIFDNSAPTIIVILDEYTNQIPKKSDNIQLLNVSRETYDNQTKQFDLTKIMQILHTQGIQSVLVESGGALLSSFYQANLWNNFYWFQAPKIIGNDGKSAIGDLALNDLTSSTVELTSRHQLGNDQLFVFGNTK